MTTRQEAARWDYRVIEFLDTDGSPYREIHEVHYGNDGKPMVYSEPPAVVMASEYEDGDPRANDGLAWCLNAMTKALTRPVLVSRDFDLIHTNPSVPMRGGAADSDRSVCVTAEPAASGSPSCVNCDATESGDWHMICDDCFTHQLTEPAIKVEAVAAKPGEAAYSNLDIRRLLDDYGSCAVNYHRGHSMDSGPCPHWAAVLAAFAAERERADKLDALVSRLRTMSTVEMMCENENVKHHVEEWERRTIKAEAEVAALRETVRRADKDTDHAIRDRNALAAAIERVKALAGGDYDVSPRRIRATLAPVGEARTQVWCQACCRTHAAPWCGDERKATNIETLSDPTRDGGDSAGSSEHGNVSTTTSRAVTPDRTRPGSTAASTSATYKGEERRFVDEGCACYRGRNRVIVVPCGDSRRKGGA